MTPKPDARIIPTQDGNRQERKMVDVATIEKAAFDGVNSLFPSHKIGPAQSHTEEGEQYVVFRNGVYHEEGRWEPLPHLTATEAIEATKRAIEAYWPEGRTIIWRQLPQYEYGYNTVDGRDLIKVVDGRLIEEKPRPEEMLWILRVRLAVI